MDENTGMGRPAVKYVLSLLFSLLTASLVGVTLFEESPDPGSPQRLVLVIVFFTVFTVLFAWDSGYLGQ
ncbi:MAG: hypothetical protein SV253_06375 [Halobacteria archaeon]|nr:hypothetical protein [Halobacteria archaeon]